MHIFFDLDGTLTDSSPGILRCVNHALAELGHSVVTDARLRGMIGSPLTRIFSDVLVCDDEAVLDRAVAAYRVRFNAVGIFENALYPGVAAALDHLCRSGHTLQIVTAKPAAAARRVAEHFGIAPFFRAMHGPELSARDCNKADLVGAALQVAGGNPRAALMVGDRAADMIAAREHRVRAVAAAWGYGSRDELERAAPEYVAETVPDLIRWVQTVTSDATVKDGTRA
ncbi:MAG TPA: HAD hydrolase-like protein [Vicinamibacterales bacterium]|nr:HAD hydrolase-like protein [Vicinamibacterales bacterium]